MSVVLVSPARMTALGRAFTVRKAHLEFLRRIRKQVAGRVADHRLRIVIGFTAIRLELDSVSNPIRQQSSPSGCGRIPAAAALPLVLDA